MNAEIGKLVDKPHPMLNIEEKLGDRKVCNAQLVSQMLAVRRSISRSRMHFGVGSDTHTE